MSTQGKYLGKFRAIVRDHHDPHMRGRIRAEVPYPLGTGEENWSVWALPCFAPGQFYIPEEGQGVWIEFENGQASMPIWSGIWYKGRGSSTEAPFQDVHPALTDFAGGDAETDKDHLEAKDPTSHAEHTGQGGTPYHDHVSQFYTPHRFGFSSHTGHEMEWSDHPGKGGYLRLRDRFGRLLRFIARGLTELVSHVTPSASWNNLSGAPTPGFHRLRFADGLNDPDEAGVDAGQYVELRDMAQAKLRMESTPGSERITLSDFWNQFVRIHSVNGAEYIEISDKDGQKLKFDPIANTVRVDDANGNFILMANGKITLSVGASSTVHVGGEAGQELATKAFVQTYYNAHTHVSGGPGSPTSIPIVQAPLTPGTDITKKQKSE